MLVTSVHLWLTFSLTHIGIRQDSLWMEVLCSDEGTTQGDPLAMPLYALATIPLINRLSSEPNVKQVWYTDDASAAGRLSYLRNWWDLLQSSGPEFGYHINARKMWLITKEAHLSEAKELFKDSEVNITPHMAGLI